MLAQALEAGGLGYERLRTLDSPALRAGNWSQLCVTCKARHFLLAPRSHAGALHSWHAKLPTLRLRQSRV